MALAASGKGVHHITTQKKASREHHDSGANIPRSPEALQTEEVSAPKNNFPITRRY